MNRNQFRWFILLGIILVNCAQPLSMQRPGYIDTEQHENMEQVLRNVDDTYRTLAVRNFTSYIRRLLGTPYEYGGTSTSGIDCSGFVQLVFEEAFSRSMPRSTEQLYNTFVPVSPFELKLGDLVFFDINQGAAGPSHVGIYLIDSYFAHASSSYGVTISRLSDSYYKSRYLGARRVTNITFE
ncbi:C40 family peptidase [candidate division KSB1 bacterium]|nr:C40 family peptidase [candidate division KSB1 bacterium]